MLRRYAALALLFIFVFSQNAIFGQQPAATPSTQPRAQMQQPGQQKDPNDPIERIKDEGMNRSQVMQTLSYLTNVIGPRLTNSPGMKRANEWTRDTMTKWGMQNARLEAWGPFGRGWSLKGFTAQVIEPQAIPVIAYPKAWSPSTKGAVTGEVVWLDARTDADLAKYKGQLRGKIVLVVPPRELKAEFEGLGKRRTDDELAKLAAAPDPNAA